MIKDIVAANESVHSNEKEIAALKQLFPGCFTKDGKFDVEKLALHLKDKVDLTREGYELNFLGKSYSKLLASIDTTTIIKPNLEHNAKEENRNSENIYISGDNLDGLKHILKSYSGMVKCIYIDPPYNTGTDGFVYADNFNFTAKELEERLSMSEEQAQRVLDLTTRKSSSHSAWLMFMHSRLKLAVSLLADNGVIFLSVDDNEQANLKLLCDDVFGEENFLGLFVVNATPNARDYGHVGKMHEYILSYAKNTLLTETYLLKNPEKKFKYKDSIGGFNIHPLYNSNEAFTKDNRPNLYYPFYLNLTKVIGNEFFEISLDKKDGLEEIYPSKSQKNNVQFVWRWGKKKASDNLNKEIVGYRTEDGEYRIVQKMRHDEKLIRSILTDKAFTTRRGTRELEELFGDKIFSFPKPTLLIQTLLSVATEENDIICDFFSGSATTAHATMLLNAAQDSTGKRKYILVQLPENLDEKLQTANTNDKQFIKKVIDFLDSVSRPHTLDQIGIERIIRAAKKIKEEIGADIDYGFKHYELCEPNQNTLDKLEKFDPQGIVADTTVLNDFGRSAVLRTWTVKDGYGFTADIEEVNLDGYIAYLCGKHLYLIHDDITDASIAVLIERYESEGNFSPETIVLFGYSFGNWSQLEMLRSNIKQLNNSDKNLKVNVVTRY